MPCSQVYDMPLNDDPRVAVRVDGREVYARRAPRVVLETATGLSATETLLLHCDASTSWTAPNEAQTYEVFVVAGDVTIDGVSCAERDYVRWFSARASTLSTKQGCVTASAAPQHTRKRACTSVRQPCTGNRGWCRACR